MIFDVDFYKTLYETHRGQKNILFYLQKLCDGWHPKFEGSSTESDGIPWHESLFRMTFHQGHIIKIIFQSNYSTSLAVLITSVLEISFILFGTQVKKLTTRNNYQK